ncbi:MAG: ion channel [Acidimicrobiia bacterium]
MTTKNDPLARLYDRFDLLFLVTVGTAGLLLLVDLREEGWTEILSVTVTLLTALMLFLAVAAAGVGQRGRRIALIIGGVGVLTGAAAILSSSSDGSFVGLAWLALLIAAPVVALRRLMEHSSVTYETILGALSVYLLLAIAATYLFVFIDRLTSASGGFFGDPQPTTVFTYFSFVTVTSLGYGDFYPVGVGGRAAAAWEAVIGQVYLVVVVARLVSLYSGGRLFPGRDERPSAD